MTSYGEFRVRIERLDRKAARRSYRVEVSGLGGNAEGRLRMPFTDTELENFILKVGRTRRGVRRLESPEMQLAKDFGGRLFRALMEGQVGERYREALGAARANQSGLRITLSLTTVPELGAVPWEYLFDATDFLSISATTPVVRYLDVPIPTRPLDVQLPLRILAVISAPSNAEDLDTAGERTKLESALQKLIDAHAVTVDWLEKPNLLALNQKLRGDTYHILHFIGHGGFDDVSGEGGLLFEDETGQGRPVSGDQLAAVVRDKHNLRLVLLNSCEGARNSVKDPFSGVAASLVERGIPAVIGMQFEITDRAAVLFASEFYAILAEGGQVDEAVAGARLAIFADHNDVEWATPVLFMRVEDGRLFTVTDAQELPRSAEVALPPKTPEKPGAGETPGATETPSATETPGATETPSATETPGAAEAPRATEAPGAAVTPVAVTPVATAPDGAGTAPSPIPEATDRDRGAATAADAVAGPPPAGAEARPGTTDTVETPAAGPSDELAALVARRAPAPSGATEDRASGGTSIAQDTTDELGSADAPLDPGDVRRRRLSGGQVAAAVGVAVTLLVGGFFLWPRPDPPSTGSLGVSTVGVHQTGFLQLQGTDFAPGEAVDITLDGVPALTVRAADDGTFSAQLRVGTQASGEVAAVGRSSQRQASRAFSVETGPDGSPTGPVGSPTGPVVANRVSPGILFYSDVSSVDGTVDRENNDLYLLDWQTLTSQPLSSSERNETFPTWSPRYDQIAYARGPSKDRGIFVRDLDSRDAGRPVSTGMHDEYFPTWSRNNWIAYVQEENPDKSSIRRVRSDGTGDRPLVTGAFVRAPAWSPDGRRLAFFGRLTESGPWRIYVVNFDGSGLDALTSGPQNDRNPNWSPDGTKIVFVRGDETTDREPAEIHTLDVETRVVSEPLTSNNVQDGNPVWSPDGTKIAFYRTSEDGFHIWMMNADGSVEEDLMPGRPGRNLDPIWR